MRGKSGKLSDHALEPALRLRNQSRNFISLKEPLPCKIWDFHYGIVAFSQSKDDGICQAASADEKLFWETDERGKNEGMHVLRSSDEPNITW